MAEPNAGPRNHNITDVERRYIEAVDEHGSARAAASALGVHHSTVSYALRRAARRGAIPIEDDADRIVPAGAFLERRTVQTEEILEDGRRVKIWNKQRFDLNESVIESVLSGLEIPRSNPVAPPEHAKEDLQQWYPIGDAHFGMLAWHREVGADFNLEIAQNLMRKASGALIRAAPAAHKAFVVNVGDFFHTNNKRGITDRGGNVLDTDSRLQKMVEFGTSSIIQMVRDALVVHLEVEVWCVPGNHDDMLAWLLSKILDEHFRDEPRVTVNTDPRAAFYEEFGKNLIGSTHGHTGKMQDLPAVMATDRAEAWGRTLHRRWFTGHFHHEWVREFPGCVVERVNTLAPADAWHWESLYRSRRNMRSITIHKDFGEVSRNTWDISRIDEW